MYDIDITFYNYIPANVEESDEFSFRTERPYNTMCQITMSIFEYF